MTCRIEELGRKEVLCIDDGAFVGYVCDVEVETCSGATVSITVEANSGFILRKKKLFRVCWSDIVVIGDDAILVKNVQPVTEEKSVKKLFDIFLK